MPTGDRKDPYAAFNFTVEIDNMTVAGFSECSGLSMQTEVIEYREGNADTVRKQLPGLKKFTPIVLKRGYTQDRQLWDWRRTAMTGRTERRGGSVILRGEDQNEVLRWNFVQGWLSKWDGPTLNAKNNEVAIESMEISHEGLELA